MRQFYIFLFSFLSSIPFGFSQNVTNIFYSGDLNSFGAAGLTYEYNRWQVTLQASSDDSDSFFLFRDSNSNFNNKWSRGDFVSFGSLDTAFWQGGDTRISVTNSLYYTFTLSNVNYNNNGQLIVQETTGAPVGFDSGSATVQTPSNNITGSTPVTVFGTLVATAPNPELRVFIRYSTDGFTTSNVVEMTNSLPNEVDGVIPGQPAGTTVNYYLFTTTVDASTITNESEYDLVTIDLENNSGSNYSYTVVNNQTTANSGNWNDVATWTSGSVPNTDDVVILNHTITINSDVVHSGNITINSPNVLSISPGHSLKFTGSTFTNNGGVLMTSTSSTFSSFIPSTSSTLDGTGGYEYFRYTNSNTNGNDLISPPLSNDTFGAFATRNSSNLFSNPGNTNKKLFGPFDTSATTPAYVEYTVGTDDAESLIAGKGYRGASVSGNNLGYVGSVLKDDVSTSIINNGETDFKSWNLVGNPFSSYVQLGVDLLNPTTLNSLDPNYQSFYFYNAGTSGSYPGATTQGNWIIVNVSYVLSNSNTAIAPGQGFFVKAKSGGGSVLFEESSRFTATDAANSDDGIAGIAGRNTTTTDNIARAKIGLSAVSDTSEIDIYFLDDATLGLDPGYDVGGFGGSSFGIFTNLLNGDTGVQMAIQSLPYSSLNNVSIPLGINMDAGTQFTLELNDVYSLLPDGIDLYLDDTLENTSTLLNSGNYVLTPSEDLNGTGRFYLRFSNSSLSTSDSNLDAISIYANQTNRSITIAGQLTEETTARVYDLQGRLVHTTVLPVDTSLHTIDASSLHTGIYIVNLVSKNYTKTKKIILR